MSAHKPYHNEAFNLVYNLLFCDDIKLYQSQNKNPGDYPWNILFNNKAKESELQKIIEDDDTETRVKILAYRQLAAGNYEVQERILLGVIIEVGLDGGLDTLAAFIDGTARYINQSEKMIVWETKTKESGEIIQQLFGDSQIVIGRIGPWNKERPAPPKDGEIRLNFLVSDGLYFGQGPLNVLQSDAMGGPVIGSAIALMQYLISNTEKK